MSLKNYNPTTPSRRALVLVDKSEVYKGKPLKKLTKGLSKSGGRNNRGRITVWWRGGGHKRSYRIVDFKRQKDGIDAKVIRIEYDPNRSCFIALIKYEPVLAGTIALSHFLLGHLTRFDEFNHTAPLVTSWYLIS